jgi:hypothetical protein
MVDVGKNCMKRSVGNVSSVRYPLLKAKNSSAGDFCLLRDCSHVRQDE